MKPEKELTDALVKNLFESKPLEKSRPEPVRNPFFSQPTTQIDIETEEPVRPAPVWETISPAVRVPNAFNPAPAFWTLAVAAFFSFLMLAFGAGQLLSLQRDSAERLYAVEKIRNSQAGFLERKIEQDIFAIERLKQQIFSDRSRKRAVIGQLRALSVISKSRSPLSSYVDRITRLKTEGVWFEKLQLTERVFILKALALDASRAEGFAERLKKDALFKEAYVMNTGSVAAGDGFVHSVEVHVPC